MPTTRPKSAMAPSGATAGRAVRFLRVGGRPGNSCREAWRAWVLSLGLLTALVGSPAMAQTQPPPANVISLSATAAMEVPSDWLTVVYATTREGTDAAEVQSQLKQALDMALAEARKVAKPGELEVRTGGFSMFPRYAPKVVGITGWQGRVELITEGRDTAAISKLSGRIQGLTIARVGFSLSRQAREKVEAEVTAQAIDRFRANAEAVSKQFGFGGYSVREVSVGSDAPYSGLQMPVMRSQAMNASVAVEALPVEAGKTTVTAQVSGTVQMK